MAPDEDPPFDPDAPVAIPVSDVLDLHAFRPSEVETLVADYLDEAHARGFRRVRIIHGKGTGTLREVVHGVLRRHPRVQGFGLAEGSGGGWGATVVVLKD